MNKAMIVRACGLAAAGLILTGCGADRFENPVPTESRPPVAAEPMAPQTTAGTLPWVGEHRTPVVSYPRGYEVGERVWIVRHDGCETPAEVRERIVLAECGPYVIVFAPELEGETPKDQAAILMTQSELVGPCLEFYNSGDAYTERADALAVAAQENGEG